ncbi:hypothetical protein [Streptomyces sp. NPDC002845]
MTPWGVNSAIQQTVAHRLRLHPEDEGEPVTRIAPRALVVREADGDGFGAGRAAGVAGQVRTRVWY